MAPSRNRGHSSQKQSPVRTWLLRVVWRNSTFTAACALKVCCSPDSYVDLGYPGPQAQRVADVNSAAAMRVPTTNAFTAKWGTAAGGSVSWAIQLARPCLAKALASIDYNHRGPCGPGVAAELARRPDSRWRDLACSDPENFPSARMSADLSIPQSLAHLACPRTARITRWQHPDRISGALRRRIRTRCAGPGEWQAGCGSQLRVYFSSGPRFAPQCGISSPGANPSA